MLFGGKVTDFSIILDELKLKIGELTVENAILKAQLHAALNPEPELSQVNAQEEK